MLVTLNWNSISTLNNTIIDDTSSWQYFLFLKHISLQNKLECFWLKENVKLIFIYRVFSLENIFNKRFFITYFNKDTRSSGYFAFGVILKIMGNTTDNILFWYWICFLHLLNILSKCDRLKILCLLCTEKKPLLCIWKVKCLTNDLNLLTKLKNLNLWCISYFMM